MPRTRLAPSPTGALHLGNVRTFLVNWALARREGWQVVLRVEDLDGPRVKTGAAEEAIDVLRWLGLDWDEGPHFQRGDLTPYQAALARLARQGDIYPCRCTRREIEAASLSAPHGDEHELRYPGTCRPEPLLSPEGRDWMREQPSTGDPMSPERRAVVLPMSSAIRASSVVVPPLAPPFEGGVSGVAWRLRVPDGVTAFTDRFAGLHEHDTQLTSGDFLVATKEGLPSYQLAVVVDDARQRIDRIVRGDDLLASTHRQLLLQSRLGLAPPPEYWHLPLVVGEDGRRLAKRHGDTRVTHYRSAGVPAERIIGLMAEWCGLAARRPMAAAEFLALFTLANLPAGQVVFTSDDDRWLLQSA